MIKRSVLLLAAILVSFGLGAQVYNDGLQRSTPEAEGIRSEAVADWFRALEEGGYEVHGLMLLRHDKVVAEHWWAPYGPQYPHAMYSATKTFTGAAVGFDLQAAIGGYELKHPFPEPSAAPVERSPYPALPHASERLWPYGHSLPL